MIVDRLPDVQALSPRDTSLLNSEPWEEFAANKSSVPFHDAVLALNVRAMPAPEGAADKQKGQSG